MNREHVTFIFDRIAYGWNTDCFCMSPEQETFCVPAGSRTDAEPMLLMMEELFQLKVTCQLQTGPAIINLDKRTALCGFTDDEGYLYAFGPSAWEPMNKADVHQFFRKRRIAAGDVHLPFLPLDRLASLLSVASLLLTGKTFTEQQILSENFPTKPDRTLPAELVRYEMNTRKAMHQHHTYEMEVAWLKQLESGTLRDEDFAAVSLDTIGVMAENEYKKWEYNMVAAITLATRAIIRGGVPPYKAYAVSDVYCQQLSKCSSIAEVYQVYAQSQSEMLHLVKQFRQRASNNVHIEKCKDYIGRHTHDKITLKDIAENVGVSSAYLSRIFSKQEGISVSQYLLKQRLIAAENMLKYSPASVGDIADYLCFNSHSHFSDCFKKEYGVTPTQYRNNAKAVW